MKKIVTLGITFSSEQKARLETLGQLLILKEPKSVNDLLKKIKGAEIVYSDGSYLLESLPQLKNVFVTYPYVELGSFNSSQLAKNNVYIANARCGNRDSIVEWVIFMTLALFREFTPMVRATDDIPFELHQSLQGKNTTIIGKGSIGTQIGKLCKSFGMSVEFFKRGGDLLESVRNADLVINALNCNPTSKNLLNKDFFSLLKNGSYFISFVRRHTYDLKGLINAINNGIVSGAAIDCDPEEPGNTSNDFYKLALSNPKILVTPHIAFSTKEASHRGAEIAIQNIENFIEGKPQNIITK